MKRYKIPSEAIDAAALALVAASKGSISDIGQARVMAEAAIDEALRKLPSQSDDEVEVQEWGGSVREAPPDFVMDWALAGSLRAVERWTLPLADVHQDAARFGAYMVAANTPPEEAEALLDGWSEMCARRRSQVKVIHVRKFD